MTGRFVERFILPKGVLEVKGWSLKAYEVTVDGQAINRRVCDASVKVIEDVLKPAEGVSVGFVILHQGTDSIWFLIDTWDEEITFQTTHFASLDEPTRFTQVEAGGPTACVWELPVHVHELDSYIREVLNPPDGPDYGSYLADQLSPSRLVRGSKLPVMAG